MMDEMGTCGKIAAANVGIQIAELTFDIEGNCHGEGATRSHS